MIQKAQALCDAVLATVYNNFQPEIEDKFGGRDVCAPLWAAIRAHAQQHRHEAAWQYVLSVCHYEARGGAERSDLAEQQQDGDDDAGEEPPDARLLRPRLRLVSHCC